MLYRFHIRGAPEVFFFAALFFAVFATCSEKTIESPSANSAKSSPQSITHESITRETLQHPQLQAPTKALAMGPVRTNQRQKPKLSDRETPYLLTAEQLLSLAPEEQIEYVHQLRLTLVEMNKSSDFFSFQINQGGPFSNYILSHFGHSSRLLQEIQNEILPKSFAAEPSRPSSAAALTSQAKSLTAQFIAKYKNQISQGKDIESHPSAAQELDAIVRTYKLAYLASKPGSDEASVNRKALEDSIRSITDTFASDSENSNRMGNTSRAKLNVALGEIRETPLTNQTANQAANQAISAPTGSMPSRRQAGSAAQSEAKGEQARATFESQEKSVAIDQTRYPIRGCMFGGFVLTQTKTCSGVESIAKVISGQKSLDENKFKCGKGEVICNPFVFGFRFDKSSDGSSDSARDGASAGSSDSAIDTASASLNQNCEAIFVAQLGIQMGGQTKTAIASKSSTQQCLKIALPLCVSPLPNATASCEMISRTTDGRFEKRALALIAAEPQAFDRFTSDFVTMCSSDSIEKNALIYFDRNDRPRKNSEYFKNDIKATCLLAQKKMRSFYPDSIKARIDNLTSHGSGSQSGASTKIGPGISTQPNSANPNGTSKKPGTALPKGAGDR